MTSFQGNLSNEFVNNKLNDNIQMNYVLKDLATYNQIPKAFLNKQRTVKETSSVGGFKIHEDKLKKRINPSNYMPSIGMSSNDKYTSFNNTNITNNDFVNYNYDTNTFNRFKSNNNDNNHKYSDTNNFNQFNRTNNYLLDQDKKGNLNYEESIENINNIANSNSPLSENLISMFEQELIKLKEEANKKFSNLNSSKIINDTNQNLIKEDKVYNEYISFSPSRVQQIKHVTTEFKPEYMSLEDIQRQRQEHLEKLLKTENEFYELKKRNERNIDLNELNSNNYNKSTQNQTLNNFYSSNQFNNLSLGDNYISNTNNENICDNYNSNDKALYTSSKQNFITNKSSNFRSKSENKLKKYNKYNDSEDKPLDKLESKYVKKFMNYLLKKKYKEANENDFNDKEDWNVTRVRSLNSKASITSYNNNNNLPGRLDSGHLDKKDYSLYYLSMDNDSPRSLSLKSGNSRSYSNQKINRKKIKISQKLDLHPTRYGSASKLTKQNVNENINKFKTSNYSIDNNAVLLNKNHNFKSNLAFIKMIFNILDVYNEKSLKKLNLESNLNLEEKVLTDLGFLNEEDFIENMKLYKTSKEGEFSEEEFCAFLMSRSDYNNDYSVDNYNKINYEANLENNKFNETNNINKCHSLNNFNNTNYIDNNFPIYKNGIGYNLTNKYNISKSAQFMMNLKRSIVNQKLKISYNEYKDFIKGYKPRNELNVTIPKPFSFYDKKGRKEDKINQILNERKQEEDKILNHTFKANELKREIFINQLGNIIESEKRKREIRQEKIKQKIVENMKPFSFYDTDEKKYKEKLLKECMPPEFLPFKANPIPWTSQVNLYEDMVTKQAQDRQLRVQERARHNLNTAKLPPRMELHERKKKLQEEETKLIQEKNKNSFTNTIRSKSTSKVVKVPDFAKEYDKFMKDMEKKKSIARPTEPKPFAFHEPKVR